jgi:cytochrome c553
MRSAFHPLILFAAPFIVLSQPHPEIPKVWSDEALRSMTMPLAGLKVPVKYAPADWYYRIPERTIYRGYPVYHPSKEPRNYMAFLQAQEPEIAFDASKLNTDGGWLRAGEAVFSNPENFGLLTIDDMHDPDAWDKLQFKADWEGSLPGWRYVIRKKGKIEIATTLCGSCHERVIDDRTVPGPPSTALNGVLAAYVMHRDLRAAKNWDKAAQDLAARQYALFSVPWQSPDPAASLERMPAAEIFKAYEALSMGVVARTGASVFFPPRIEDLIGVKEREYLGATGLHRNRGIEDLMRYEILESGFDEYSQYGDARPMGALPQPGGLQRLSDAQAYALALYIYSLKPPANPNKLDVMAKRGQKIFEREGCAGCHPAPLYTNNKLAPVEGGADAIGTDSRLTLQTRKGTGYYRVPSLKGVWYREPFEHNGSFAMLEDWFDSARMRDDYPPSGFKGYGVETRAVKGHPFGIKLSFDERRALTAFLRTL